LEQMQKRAVEIFSQRFTAEIFAQNIENVYYKAMEGKDHE